MVLVLVLATRMAPRAARAAAARFIIDTTNTIICSSLLGSLTTTSFSSYKKDHDEKFGVDH